ncbi:MAG: hypothetical protein WC243_03185 [Patescibacteria group bacterium]|jgi:hypothetical protein
MLIPEYTITSHILTNIAAIEYSKAVIDNTVIFPNWEKQMQKEAEILFIESLLQSLGKRVEQSVIKTHVDSLNSFKLGDPDITGLGNAMELSEIISGNLDLGEDDLKEIYKTFGSGPSLYRQTKLPERAAPEEILAKTVEFMDWYNSLDARETHPVIRAGILRAYLELLSPFENKNTWLAAIVGLLSLKANGYDIRGYLCLESYFESNKREYSRAFSSVKEDDFTQWLEFYTLAFSSTVTNLKEKVVLLSRDTKVAKASGKADLTDRQQRIIEYLQDYGSIQNRNFPMLFPSISEDSVLRDIKVLLDKGIITKIGKTKSSRYELK